MPDEEFHVARDMKEAAELAAIIDDETKSDAVRDKAAIKLIDEVYGLGAKPKTKKKA